MLRILWTLTTLACVFLYFAVSRQSGVCMLVALGLLCATGLVALVKEQPLDPKDPWA